MSAELAGESVGGDGTARRDPQRARYRNALDERDGKRPGPAPSVLALVVPDIDDTDRAQAAQADSRILRWREIADLAGDCARDPQATLEVADLETFIWFVGAAEMTGREFVGIDHVSEPPTRELAEYYAASRKALAAVGGLIDRDARSWKTKAGRC